MQPDKKTSAPLYRRLMAMMYDLFLLAATLFCAAMLYTAIAVSFQGGDAELATVETGQVLTELEPVDLGPAFPVFILSVAAAFYLYFWKNGGQTLGMKVWRLKLLGNEGDAAATLPCLLRIPLACLSFLALGLGYWYMKIEPAGRTLHDRLSKTQVVLLEKPGEKQE